MSSFDILVCAIPHRLAKLDELLQRLEPQIQPKVRVLIAYDNLELSYGEKCQRLLKASQAEYVAMIDDDDLPAENYVELIMETLKRGPDYVGFPVYYTLDGRFQKPVFHTLSCGGWYDFADSLWRDIQQFQPIRRKLALMGDWVGGNGADRTWSNSLREAGVVKREIYIDQPLLHYRNESEDTFTSLRAPFCLVPAPPQYKFARYL